MEESVIIDDRSQRVTRSGFRSSISRPFNSRLSRVGIGLVVAIFGLILIGSLLTPYSPSHPSGFVNKPPSMTHIFGTDYLGHDLFSQIVWGAYPSLFVAVGAAFGSVILGFIVGIFSGYYNKLEGILGGASDVVMAFPALPLLIIVGSILPATDILIMSILILVMWPPVTRAVRVQVQAVKELPYVEAARTSGLSNLQILRKIMVPEVGSIAVAYFVLNAALAIVLTTALEFLGVGNPDAVSWGSILYWAQQFGFDLGDWWWIVAPGAIITLTATGFTFLGFALEETFNPRLRNI